MSGREEQVESQQLLAVTDALTSFLRSGGWTDLPTSATITGPHETMQVKQQYLTD